MGSFNKVNINAPRYGNIGKVEEIRNLLLEYDPLLVCIQEISVSTAIRVFAWDFQVYFNIEDNAQDGVGKVSLVRKTVVC